jgi:hypothetical protein
LVALDAQYGNRHLVTDHHGLTNPSRQYQHIRAPNLPWQLLRRIDRLGPASPAHSFTRMLVRIATRI